MDNTYSKMSNADIRQKIKKLEEEYSQAQKDGLDAIHRMKQSSDEFNELNNELNNRSKKISE